MTAAEAAQPANWGAYRRLFAANVLALLGTGIATVGLAPVAFTLPWVDAVWQVYLQIFVFQAASGLLLPAYQATVPDLLPDEPDHSRAIAKARLAYDLEGLLSPALAAAFLVLVTWHGLFVGTSLGFLVSALLIARAGVPSPRPRPGGNALGRLALGLRAFRDQPQLRGLVAIGFAAAVASAMVALGVGCAIAQTPATSVLRRSCSRAEGQQLDAVHFAPGDVWLIAAHPLAGHLAAAIGAAGAFAVFALLAAVGMGLAAWHWPARDARVIQRGTGAGALTSLDRRRRRSAATGRHRDPGLTQAASRRDVVGSARAGRREAGAFERREGKMQSVQLGEAVHHRPGHASHQRLGEVVAGDQEHRRTHRGGARREAWIGRGADLGRTILGVAGHDQLAARLGQREEPRCAGRERLLHDAVGMRGHEREGVAAAGAQRCGGQGAAP